MDIPPDLEKAIPGVAGSLTALLFIRENWRRSAALLIAGAVAAKFLGSTVAGVMGSNAEVAGYATGLFGMAIVAKAFDLITNFDARKAAADLWGAVVKRFGG